MRASEWLFVVVTGLVALRGEAATCVWNAPGGDWNAIANWNGCADAPGPSTRTPGATDIALIGSGAANFNVNATVAEFEIGSGASLTLIGGAPLTLTVNNALRLNGGTLSTTNTNSFPFFSVIIAAGGSGQVLATSTLNNTVELENRGVLQLNSSTGTALNVLVLSRVINVSGSSFNLGGGDARVHLDGVVPLTVRAGAVLNTSGNVYIGKSIASVGSPRIESYGTLNHVGPGTLTIQGSGSGGGNAAVLQVEGLMTISNGTLLCNQLADICRQQNGVGGSVPLRIEMTNALYDRGGPAAIALSVPLGSELVGTGTINSKGNIGGSLVPGVVGGAPYGTLGFTGDVLMNTQGVLDVDLGGSAAGSFDQVQVGGSFSVGGVGTPDGRGILNLRLAAGYSPSIGASVPIVTYASALAESAFYRVDANYALDYEARFDATALRVAPAPRIFVEDVSVLEGASGTTAAVINLRLSQTSAQTVTAVVQVNNGTAVSGLSPSGDFLFPGSNAVTFLPGETLQTKPITINGDTVVEGDESFTLEVTRNKINNAAIGNGVPGSPVGSATILTDELAPGTRFVLVGKTTSGNQVRRYTTGGVLIDAWGPSQGNFQNYIATGMCFSPSGNVLTTRFGFTNPILHNRTGAVLDDSFGRPPGSFGFNLHESCVFDRAGNAYVGQAGVSSSTDAQVPVRKFNRYGVAVEDFVLPTGPRGTDWIDLAGDQCTLYYTSEDTTVRRYNLCTHTALPVFASGLTEPYCYALRLRPNHQVMVACQEAVHRLSPQGINLQTYTRQSIGETDATGLFALNLDPDGTSFWTAGGVSGNVYRVDIASGAVLATFNSGIGGVSGLAVYDELSDDTIFLDGFEAPPALVPIVATGPSGDLFEAAEECEREFWPPNVELPHYVPAWVSVIARDADGNECVD